MDVKIPGPELDLNDEGVPIVYERALIIYDYMLENIESSVYEGQYQQYKGRITDELEEQCGITLSQYSRSMKLLKAVNAVEQVGRSNEGSHWVLYRRPTIEDFDAVRKENYQRVKKHSKVDILTQRVQDLVSVVTEHEDRINALEEKLYGQD